MVLNTHQALIKHSQDTTQERSTRSKVYFLVGPTATGKTQLALSLMKVLNADALSADSRQVYQGLECTTGVDLPTEFLPQFDPELESTVFSDQLSTFCGVSMIKPSNEWSISHFRHYAEKTLQNSQDRGKNLLIVGGSGLFHHSLFLDKRQLDIRPDQHKRAVWARTDLSTLQQLLLILQPDIQTQMNRSDWQNPRRLIRRLELLSSMQLNEETSEPQDSVFGLAKDWIWIGLTRPIEQIDALIAQRVESRIRQGAIHEVEKLYADIEQLQPQVLPTLGLKAILAHIEGQIDRTELISIWTQKERSYARRQHTWFKKQSQIHWIDTSILDPLQTAIGVIESFEYSQTQSQ